MLCFGAVAYPVQTRRWLGFLRDDPILWDLARSHPRFGLKIFRPYLSRHMNCAARVEILMQHYDLTWRAGFANFVTKIAVQPKTLCEFSGKSGTVFQIEISAPDLDNREGEFFLHLISDKVSVYRAAFSFFTMDGVPYVKIGCVQGLRADDGAAFVRFATREFHGCRPKNLLVSVVRDIGDYFGCTDMIGIGNGNRVLAYGGRHEKKSPDYDQTWEEMSATRREDGDFQLPCTGILKTSFDAIPSKKRAEAKRKMALLESIFLAVRGSLEDERSKASHSRTGRLNHTVTQWPVRYEVGTLDYMHSCRMD